MLKITFDVYLFFAGQRALGTETGWNQIQPTARAFGDPILFTDRGWPPNTGMPASLGTGRTFASQLEGLTPAG